MWKAVFVVLGAVVGGTVVWFGSWPGLALFGVLEGDAKGVRYGIAIGVLVFALLGFWLGSLLDERAGRNDSPQRWKAVFAVLGAVVGYVIGWVVSVAASRAIGLKGDPAIAIAVWLNFPVAGAAFSLLGFRLGSALDGRSRRSDFRLKWKAAFAALGAAVGPVVGFYVVSYITVVSMAGDHWRELFAFVAGLCQGAPIGGILFCLLGFCLGSALDERLRRNDSQIENSDSA